jgi:hypothetical protein
LDRLQEQNPGERNFGDSLRSSTGRPVAQTEAAR